MPQHRPADRAIRAFLAERFPQPLPHIETVTDGVSTHVYRLRSGDDVSYLRLLPEIGARISPEAEAHRLMRARGARVPDIRFAEDFNPLLGRSVMITDAIPGVPLTAQTLPPDTLRALFFAAGQDLARINSIDVAGFGWIQRYGSGQAGLHGEHPTERAFVADIQHEVLPLLDRLGLAADEMQLVRDLLQRPLGESSANGWLAHGDFDGTHIYQHEGKYSGIIDFGEIRGANPWYDLAHFRLHDGEQMAPVFPWLLEGYASVTSLPDDLGERLRTWSLLIGLRALARSMATGDTAAEHTRRHLRTAIQRDLATL